MTVRALALDVRTPVPASDATGIVPDGTGWDEFVSIEVKLADLGLTYERVRGIALLTEIAPADQALLIESILLHLEPFRRWVTILAPDVWREAVAHDDARIDVAFDDGMIVLRFHASRIARAFQQDLARAAAEGEE